MNYVKHLRKIVLLGVWASCLTIRAEGTLPIPGNKEAALPFNLNGRVSEVDERGTVVPRPDLGMLVSIDVPQSASVDPKIRQRCRTGENFYPASGQVQVGIETFDIQGLCAPSIAPGKRQVLAVSEETLVRLDGMMQAPAADGTTKFEGEIQREPIVAPVPAPAPAPGIPAKARRLIFKLNQTGL